MPIFQPIVAWKTDINLQALARAMDKADLASLWPEGFHLTECIFAHFVADKEGVVNIKVRANTEGNPDFGICIAEFME